MTVREQLVRHMTALSNCVDSMFVTSPQEVRDACAALDKPERMRRLSRSRPKDACRRSLRLLARRWLDAEREAVRCLCRFIAREVYRLLTGPQEPLPDGGDLASRRRALGITQTQLADAIGTTRSKIFRAEHRK